MPMEAKTMDSTIYSNTYCTNTREYIMKPYEERLAEAKTYTAKCLEGLDTSPNPKQKFTSGQKVHIAKDLGQNMSHFPSDFEGIVEYTCAQMYGGTDYKSYSIIHPTQGAISWYKEVQLTAIKET